MAYGVVNACGGGGSGRVTCIGCSRVVGTHDCWGTTGVDLDNGGVDCCLVTISFLRFCTMTFCKYKHEIMTEWTVF